MIDFYVGERCRGPEHFQHSQKLRAIGCNITKLHGLLDSSGDLERFSGDGDSEIYNYEFVIDSENKPSFYPW